MNNNTQIKVVARCFENRQKFNIIINIYIMS